MYIVATLTQSARPPFGRRVYTTGPARCHYAGGGT